MPRTNVVVRQVGVHANVVLPHKILWQHVISPASVCLVRVFLGMLLYMLLYMLLLMYMLLLVRGVWLVLRSVQGNDLLWLVDIVCVNLTLQAVVTRAGSKRAPAVCKGCGAVPARC